MKKKLLPWCLIGAFVAVIGVALFAQEKEARTSHFTTGRAYIDGEQVDGIAITGYTGKARNIIIPSVIDGKTVLVIGTEAFTVNDFFAFDIVNTLARFFQRNKLKSVVIPESVIMIDDYAFAYNNLTSITLPKGLKTIKEYAFAYNRLTNITLPEGITSIEDRAFYENPLVDVTVPDSVTHLGHHVFIQAKDIKSAVVAPTDFSTRNTTGGVEITDYKGNAISVSIPSTLQGKTVVAIGKEAFAKNYLVSVTMSEGLKTIGEGAFYDNPLKSVIMPEGLTTIGEGAFSYHKISSVIIPQSVITIGKYAFGGRYLDGDLQLTSVTIPDNVTNIGEGAFGSNDLVTAIIGDGVTTIGDYSFYDNKLTSVTIGQSVTIIGDNAFSQNQLESVTITAPIPPSLSTSYPSFYHNLRIVQLYVPAESVEAYEASEWANHFGSISAIP